MTSAISRPPGAVQQTKSLGNHRKVSERLNLALLHQIMSMHLDGAFRRPQCVSDLLVRLAANQQVENVTLARRELGNERTQDSHPMILRTYLLAMREGTLDRLEQLLLAHRFGQKIFGAGLDRLHARWNIPMAGQKNDGQPMSQLGEASLQLRSIHAGHLHVEQDAGRLAAEGRRQQLHCRAMKRDLIAAGIEQLCNGRSKRGIVVDNMNDGRARPSQREFLGQRQREAKRCAAPGRFSARILPP